VTHSPKLNEQAERSYRPHQALGYQTPLQLVKRWKSRSQKAECLIETKGIAQGNFRKRYQNGPSYPAVNCEDQLQFASGNC